MERRADRRMAAQSQQNRDRDSFASARSRRQKRAARRMALQSFVVRCNWSSPTRIDGRRKNASERQTPGDVFVPRLRGLYVENSQPSDHIDMERSWRVI